MGLAMANIIPAILKAGGDMVMFCTLAEEWTYKEEYERINQLSHALIDLGTKRSDKVGYMVNDRRVAFEVVWGCWVSCFIHADVNARFHSDEIEYVLKNCEVKTLVVEDVFIDEVRPILSKTKVEKVIVLDTGMGKEIPEGWYEYESLISKYPKTQPELPWEHFTPDDPVTILNTTGTTGAPKGILFNLNTYVGLLTEAGTYAKGLLPEVASFLEDAEIANPTINSIVHSNLVQGILTQPATGDLVEKGMRVLLSSIVNFLYKTSDKAAQSVVYTVFWLLRRVLNIGGMVGAEPTVSVGFIYEEFLGTMLVGHPTALLTGRHFDPIEMYKLIEKYKLGMLLLSGDTMINILADAAEPGEYDTSSVMVAASTSMQTSPSTRKRLAERFPNAVYADSFSSTEVVVSTLSLYTHDMMMNEAPTRFRMPSYAELFDENHNPVPVGEPGMFYQKAGAMSVGYYGEPEKYEKISFTDADGVRWVSMGDYAVEGEDGLITVVGRGSEVINTGGLKVWCEECERVLIGHPKIADVAYTGVPDEKWGHAVTALIQLKEGEKATEEEMIDWCKEKMAGYKAPKHVIFTDIPYVDIAKKRRRAIEEIAMEKLGIK